MNSTTRVGSLLDRKGRAVWSIGPDSSVFHAIAMMSERGVGALLVMENGALVGIISERDYMRKVILQGRLSKATAVMEIMTSPVVTISERATIGECMRLMTDERIRHLPVVGGDGSVVGVVSIGDLVKEIITEQEEQIHQLHQFIAAEYPR